MNRVVAALLTVAVCAGRASAADEPAPVTAPATITAPVVAPAAAEPEFDPFLQPVKSVETDTEAERLKTRRTFLKVHQAAGLTSLGLLIGQVVVGQMLINKRDNNEIDDSYEQLKDVHLALGISTFTAYAIAAGAAISAPKVDRTDAWDTVTAHKGLALVHGAGMMITPFLGLYNKNQADKLAKKQNSTQADYDRIERLQNIHQYTGYTTAAALAGAFITITLR